MSKMTERAVRVSQQQTNPIKIRRWKTRRGVTVPIGRTILIYEVNDTGKPKHKKLKAAQAGIIHRIFAKEGNVVQPGEPLYEIKACSHPSIMNDSRAKRRQAHLRKVDDSRKSTASGLEQAQKIGNSDNDRLIKDRKLVLLVDLDQTLIHTTNDNIPPNIKDVYHFQRYGRKLQWYHTRLRPGTHKFLESIYEFYELHICTFGSRNYAEMIAMFLDPNQKFFTNRILSRDECFDPTSKTANLRALFPRGDHMVCIIDDREDVWSYASNLIRVKPYHFFQHTGDINAPPGLDKHEDDDKEGVDLTKIVKILKEKNTQEDIDKGNAEKLNEAKEEDIATQTAEENKEIQDNNEESGKNDSGIIKNQAEQENETIGSAVGLSNKESQLNEDTEKTGTEKDELTSEATTDAIKDGNSSNVVCKKEKVENENISENVDNEKITEKVDIDNNSTSVRGEEKSILSHNDDQEKNENVDDKTVTVNENNGKLKAVNNIPPVELKVQMEDALIEIEDPDDYLVYLEDILKRIHTTFYKRFDKMPPGKIPNLKKIIPRVRSKVLKGCKLVFSGLVPTRFKLEQSKAFQVARSLGAEVQANLDGDTTHLVAVKPGTAKVNAGRRKKNLKIVTSDWLWCCAERWEHVDERIFPLNSRGSKKRHLPPHCSNLEDVTSYPDQDTPSQRKKTPSARFMDTINPLMSSSDEIANMDKEVEDILIPDDESDGSEEEPVIEAQADQGDDENGTNIEEVNFKHLLQTEILETYDKQQDDGEREPFKESESEDEQDSGDKKSVICRAQYFCR